MSTLPCGHPKECVSNGVTVHCRWCAEVAELREHLNWVLDNTDSAGVKFHGAAERVEWWFSCLNCGEQADDEEDLRHSDGCKYIAAVRAAEGK